MRGIRQKGWDGLLSARRNRAAAGTWELRLAGAVLLAVAATLPAAALGQGRFGAYEAPGFDRIALDYRLIAEPYASVRNPDVAGEQVRSVEQDLRLTVPLAGQLGERLWLAGIGWRKIDLEYKGFDPALNSRLIPELYSTTLSLAVLQRLRRESYLFLFGAVGRSADTPAPGSGATRTTGGAVYELRTDPRTVWGLGAATTLEFGERRLVPILAYRYWGDTWRANVRLPFSGDVIYVWSDWVQVGGELRAQGGEFSVTAEGAPVDRVQYSSADLGALLRVGRPGALQGELSLGSTIYRQYRALENGQEQLSLNLERGPYVRLGARYRF